jgi:hypothetical protein
MFLLARASRAAEASAVLDVVLLHPSAGRGCQHAHPNPYRLPDGRVICELDGAVLDWPPRRAP